MLITDRWTFADRASRFADGGNFCSFGVISGPVIAALTAVGVGAETAAVVAPALIGAAGGAAVSGITGGDPLLGAAGGALTGGAIGGLGPAVGEAAGIGATAGDVLVGAGTGALFNGVTGGNPLTGALTGGASGLVAGLNAPEATTPGGVTPGQASADLAATPTTGAAGGTGTTAPAPPAVASSLGTQPFDLTQTAQLASAGPGLTATDAAIGAPGGGVAPSADALAASGGAGAPGASGFTLRPDVPGGFGDLGGLSGGGGGGSFDSGAGAVNIPSSAIPSAPSLQPALGSSLEAPLGSGGAAPAGTGTSSPGLAEKTLTDLGVGPKTAGLFSKAAGPAIAGGGLLYSLVNPTTGSTPANTAALQSTANALNTQGSALVNNFLTTGQLPPGARAAVDQATAAAKAHVRSQFAQLGLSGSTMESEALNQVDSNAAGQIYNIGSSLLQTGLDQTKLASDLYTKLIGIDQTQSQQTGQAISSLAAALSGGGGTTIRLAA